MSCREFVELVTDYFDGVLSAADTARFEEHVSECVWCSRYLEQIRVTITTVGRLDEASISPAARDELLHAFRGWHAGRPAS
jgi:anti-sigma factor RsiW